MSAGKILVVRGGAIGDFILTLPVFSALRVQFPKARLEVLGYPQVVALAQAGGLVDAFRSIEARALAGFFARGGTLDSELQEYFAGFNIVISYLYDPDGIFQANVARCSKAQFICGPHRPDEQRGIHATEVFLKPLERLAVFAADATPQLQIPGASKPHMLAVHPGSGSERKNWPEEKWSELLPQLVRDHAFNLLLIGGEAEGDRVHRLTSQLAGQKVEIAQNLPLIELAQRLAGCRLFLGHDSGISHLAAALRVRSIVLLGESSEAVWRPKGTNVSIIKSEGGLQALPLSRVSQALRDVMRDR